MVPTSITPPPQANRSASVYIPVLDGLRALAIGLVLAAHAGLDRFVPGAFGVTLFFFVSGYLITRQLLGELHASGRLRLGNFFARRVLRLAPAGLAYIAIAGLVYVAAGGAISPPGWFAAIFYGANIYELWVGYRSTLTGVRHPLNILWSLAIEEHFYVLWPFLLASLWRWRHLAAFVAALCLAVLAWRFWLFGHCGADWVPSRYALCGRLQPNPAYRYNRLYQGSDARLDSIAWGALLAIVEQRRPGSVQRAARLWPAGAAMVAGSFLLRGEFGHQVLRPSVQGVALALLFPAILYGRGAVQRALSARLARGVGRLSYSLYLWHWGAFAAADSLAGTDRPRWLGIALLLALMLSLSSYNLIEKPTLRWRQALRKR